MQREGFAAAPVGTGVGAEHWMEMKANICKIVTLARKMVVEHKREQQEMLKFPALVSGSYKGKGYRTESRYSGDFLFNIDFHPFKVSCLF